MKKIWAGILVLLASAALASAEITVGVKGTLSVSGNTWAKDVEESLRAVRAALKTVGFKSERHGAIVGGGGSVFFHWGFLVLGYACTFYLPQAQGTASPLCHFSRLFSAQSPSLFLGKDFGDTA